jgi:hypothetical protein
VIISGEFPVISVSPTDPAMGGGPQLQAPRPPWPGRLDNAPADEDNEAASDHQGPGEHTHNSTPPSSLAKCLHIVRSDEPTPPSCMSPLPLLNPACSPLRSKAVPVEEKSHTYPKGRDEEPNSDRMEVIGC